MPLTRQKNGAVKTASMGRYSSSSLDSSQLNSFFCPSRVMSSSFVTSFENWWQLVKIGLRGVPAWFFDITERGE